MYAIHNDEEDSESEGREQHEVYGPDAYRCRARRILDSVLRLTSSSSNIQPEASTPFPVFTGALFDTMNRSGVGFSGRRDVIRASGADAVTYLQGQMSQDLGAMAVGSSAWSLLLQPQGKLTAMLHVTRVGAEEFVLTTDVGTGDEALARLQRFRLRVDCELTLTTEPVVSVRGGVEAPTDLPESVVVAGFAWQGVNGFDFIGNEATMPEGVVELNEEQAELLRISIGLPKMGAELTESTIPAEAGIVTMSASFTKGCYTGQELVARIDSRANNTPRRLARLTLDAGMQVEAGDELTLDGAVVGRLTSIGSNEGSATLALGYLTRKAGDATEFKVGENDGSVRLAAFV